MPLQQTSGNSTQDAYGGGVAVEPVYIESIFSTYLYTGNSSTQNIVNGIDLAGKGGLVWLKGRSLAVPNNLWDSARGINNGPLESDNTNQAYSNTPRTITSFNSDGFSMQDDSATFGENVSPRTYASWTFRKQPKFFDVVTWTGDGTGGRQIPHSLGSMPGCVIIKSTSTTGNWFCVSRKSDTVYSWLKLNTTAAQFSNGSPSNTLSSTWFVPEYMTDDGSGNGTGVTYVAYLFAHNAGGFGVTGTDNVISCGSFTTDGTGKATVSLGYEPQWMLWKQTDGVDNWYLNDIMRGMNVSGSDKNLSPNTSAAESAGGYDTTPTATGFIANPGIASKTYIYIAIRRGPMKVPTDATKVFSPVNQTGGGTVTTNFPVDLLISTTPSSSAYRSVNDRLRGASTTRDVVLYTNVTDAETVGTGYGFGFDNNTGFKDANYSNSFTDLYLNFRRAPGFFDEVCFDENVVNTSAIPHNLTVVPELAIYKKRSSTSNWLTFTNLDFNKYLRLNTTDALVAGVGWAATSTTINLSQVTGSATSVVYLFATCPGVSKVGSYTGNGTTQTINCGFTAGARFVLIKRTDSTGNWMTFDTARGMTVSTDPFLSLNSTSAETATLGACTTVTTGFAVNEAILTGINTNGASYIFLSVA